MTSRGRRMCLEKRSWKKFRFGMKQKGKKIPLRFWRFLRTGAYKMSADEKHIVNKKTGHAYEPGEGGLVTDAPEHDEPGTRKE